MMAGLDHWSYNQIWKKEINFPESFNFQKDNFFIDLAYEIGSEEDNILEHTGIAYYGLINLYSPK